MYNLPQRWKLIQAVPERGPVNHLDLHNVVDCFVKGGGLLFETLCLEMRNYWILIDSVTFSKLFIHATYLNAISTRSYDVEGELLGRVDGVEGDVLVHVPPHVRYEIHCALVHQVGLRNVQSNLYFFII